MFKAQRTSAPINRFPFWKYVLIIALVFIAFLYALPNLYGESPSVQISPKNGDKVDAILVSQIKDILLKNQIQNSGVTPSTYALQIRFNNTDQQLAAQDTSCIVTGKQIGRAHV